MTRFRFFWTQKSQTWLEFKYINRAKSERLRYYKQNLPNVLMCSQFQYLLNPNKPGLNSKQERLGQGYHNPALESSYPRFLSWWREGRGFESRRGQVLFLFHYIRSKVFNFLGDILSGHNVFDCTIINFKTDWPENFVKYTWKKTGFFFRIHDHEFSE